ncbi:MAG: hypothetical protein MK098_01265 [Marinovum sp.]|nr:hypothetical protein [Marinovum sp.]
MFASDADGSVLGWRIVPAAFASHVIVTTGLAVSAEKCLHAVRRAFVDDDWPGARVGRGAGGWADFTDDQSTLGLRSKTRQNGDEPILSPAQGA